MYIGCDIGTGYSKGVLIDEDGRVMASVIIPTNADPRNASKTIIDELLNKAKVDKEDIKGCASIGWGRSYVLLEHKELSLINCIARSANFVYPSCRTVIDIGAQHSMVITVDEKGQVMEFRQNDRCAAGAGRFVEVISEALRVPLEKISDLVMNAGEKVNVTSQCAVFAESEVIAHVNDGRPVDAILAGIIDSLSRSLIAIAKRIPIQDDVVVSGGMAKNRALVKAMEQNLGKKLHMVGQDPQLLAALGAALFIKEEV
jgi:predicted CoA-substrate-specific enzyme activase